MRNVNNGGSQYGMMRRSPYAIAVVLAIVMFLLVAPEINEGDAMKPTISDGNILVVSKASYSEKRDIPERDTIVILEKNVAPSVSQDNIIARVAGLPGENVSIKDGKVYIDDKEYITVNGIKGSGGKLNITLKKNEVFLLCDNREVVLDSRNKGLGAVDMREIKGNVLIRIWPLSKFGGIK